MYFFYKVFLIIKNMFWRHTKRYLIVTVVYTIVFLWLYVPGKADTKVAHLELPLVVVHLDLKGMPPKMSYLKSLLPNMRKLGANALLMEYEDMFPYEGMIRNLSSRFAYNKQELSDFLREAHALEYEIIPLVQTFGHLEFVLKLPEFRHLRENPFSPDSICPTNNGSLDLIRHMLEQVIVFHNKISPLKNFHIGCDEVYNMNLCEYCKARQRPNLDLFVSHVNNVHGILKSINPHINILIWDDMIRKIRRTSFKIIDRLLDVEPVYWDYVADVRDVHRSLLFYKKRFKNTWIASAFKGADGRTKMLPDLSERFENNLNWLKCWFKHRRLYKFKGIMLTGWSRYGHMDPPCELLPVSMSSLTLNLLLTKKFKDGLESNSTKLSPHMFYKKYLEVDLKKELHCYNHDLPYLNYSYILHCDLPGKMLACIVYDFDKFQRLLVNSFIADGLETVEFYYNNYNIVSPNSFSHMNRINESLETLDRFTTNLPEYLNEYYDVHFTKEYVNYKTAYLRTMLTKLISILESFASIRVWSHDNGRYITLSAQ